MYETLKNNSKGELISFPLHDGIVIHKDCISITPEIISSIRYKFQKVLKLDDLRLILIHNRLIEIPIKRYESPFKNSYNFQESDLDIVIPSPNSEC